MSSAADLLNKPAPDFSLPMLGGGRFVLSDQRGHPVIIHFWSAECPWSRRADLVLLYRQREWEQKKIRVVGIACNVAEPESEIRYEAKLRQLKYPLAFDLSQDITNIYRVQMTPHFWVIDSRGVVRYTGALDDATAEHRAPKVIYLDKAIQAVLEDQTPDPAFVSPYGSAMMRQLPGAGHH